MSDLENPYRNKSMEKAQLRAHVLLGIQRALLGHVGTAVRTILCRWRRELPNAL